MKQDLPRVRFLMDRHSIELQALVGDQDVNGRADGDAA